MLVYLQLDPVIDHKPLGLTCLVAFQNVGQVLREDRLLEDRSADAFSENLPA